MTTPQPPVGTPWHGATFVAAFSRFWRGYVAFRGRAARAELLWWTLWWFIFTAVVNVFYGIGLFSTTPAVPSAAENAMMDRALDRFNPFPVWGYLLSTMPPVAQIALGVFGVVGLAAVLPWIAIAVRRLHDTNRSGWWVLMYFLPLFNVVLLVFLLLPSDERGARFGSPRPSTPGAGSADATMSR